VEIDADCDITTTSPDGERVISIEIDLLKDDQLVVDPIIPALNSN
jgi:hypothetical protein